MGIIELILNQELLTELLSCLLSDVIVLQFEGNFRQITIELMK